MSLNIGSNKTKTSNSRRVGIILSTAKKNPGGLKECDRRQFEKLDQIPSGEYKKRHLKMLSVDEKRNIIHDNLVL